MVKKIIVTTLIIILVGAVGVAAYDVYQGTSSLDLPDANLLLGQGRQGQGTGQVQGHGQQGQGFNNGSGQPQASTQEWLTLEGTVVSVDRQNLLVETAQMGQVSVETGPPWFADEQGVIFNPGDAVTLLGFTGEGGLFQAGQVTNQANNATLFLRDPNGRPLWAGRGQGQTTNP